MKDLTSKIKEWAQERREWQQEALRRLWGSQSLSDADIEELTELCKKPHGLSDTTIEVKALGETVGESSVEDVLLKSITHNGNVNALAAGQKILFGKNLTVVYGENGAGKSGYARILKSACRARGTEEIIGNVLSGEAPGVPSATISLSVQGEERSTEWHDDQPEPLLNNVSVFDSSCAVVYLKDKTDVAYRPFGLDLFDKLSSACNEVRANLEKEKRTLERLIALPELPPGTKAATSLSNLSSLTEIKLIRTLLELDEKEENRRKELKTQLQTLAEADPDKAIKELELRAGRVQALAKRVAQIESFLPQTKLKTLAENLSQEASAREALSDLKREAFSTQPLPGTGTEEWLQLWKAAERFSKSQAYVSQPFPVSLPEEHCLLCQQKLGDEGKTRLEGFAEFLASSLSQRASELRASTEDICAGFKAISFDGVEETIGELKLESEELGGAVEEMATRWGSICERVAMVSDPSAVPSGEEVPSNLSNEIEQVAENLIARAAELSKAMDPEQKKQLLSDSRELEARKLALDKFDAYEEEVDRLKRLAAYELALKDTNTNRITRKSAEFTRETVTKKLIEGFKAEIDSLKFRHIEVELQEAGGGRGSLYHKLALKRNSGVTVAKVVSEGEARCLAVAAFFAELATGGAGAPIVFDDPVSSLDHVWRERIANRLVKESSTRQVIVFTHDIVFLLALKHS